MARKICVTLGGAVMMPCLIAAPNMTDPTMAVLVIAGILFGFQVAIGNVQTIPGDLFDGRSVGFVCNDQLFLKPTDAGRAVLGQPVLGAPYHWVQTPHYLISADRWDDRDALHAAVMATAGALPCPKPRKPKAAAR